ncbi:exopolysaccharide biosynthesis polyprenyl glycosylphosphotransferase [Bradyrhizobium sp. STM 3562]|uniref:exopolysaccharide biosynthesis polyprenyl glycosylphosphotransferase n=1 Tax=Bradyrhizobium sp. STM 3562 TaxID=578924 RepID=UPI003890C535
MNFVSRHAAVNVPSEVVSRTFAPRLQPEQKWPIRYRSIETLAISIDLAAILLASLLSALLYPIDDGGTLAHVGKALGSAIVVASLFVSLLKIYGRYKPTELLVFRDQIRVAGLAWTFALLLLAAAVGALNFGQQLFHGTNLIFILLGFILLIADRAAIRALIMKGLSGRKFAGGKVVLITDRSQSQDSGLAQALATFGFSITGCFSLPPPHAGSGYRKRFSSRVIEHIRGSDIEEIVLEADANRWHELRKFVADLRVLPFPVVFVPIGVASEILKRPTRGLGHAICVELQREPLSLVECAAKRLTDLLGAGLTLIMLSPLLAAVAVAIKLDSRGPVLFKQQRCGFNGRSFGIYKFRTMVVLEDGQSITQARPGDSRVTRIGKWLRRTSIDELPQLLNVLDGSMSLVGPRPHAVAQDGEFDKIVRNYAFRRRVKPGLTGWAQIHGCRGPTPTPAFVERRVEYDLWYIDNWSLGLDLAILLQTPIEVLRGRNAY